MDNPPHPHSILHLGLGLEGNPGPILWTSPLQLLTTKPSQGRPPLHCVSSFLLPSASELMQP